MVADIERPPFSKSLDPPGKYSEINGLNDFLLVNAKIALIKVSVNIT